MDPFRRFTLQIPLAYSQRIRNQFGENGQKALINIIKNNLERNGFCEVRLVMQDPTNNEIFTVLGRTRSYFVKDPIYKVIKVENTDEPPPYIYNNKINSDNGLLPDETTTLQHALLYEDNPRHLSGFASTFEPYFPMAASLLRAKAMLREGCVIRNQNAIRHANNLAANEIAKSAVGAELQTLNWLSVKPYEQQIIKKLIDLSNKYKWSDIAKMWQQFAYYANRPGWYRFDKLMLLKNKRNLNSDITVSQLRQALIQYSQQKRIPIEILEDEVKRVACLLIQDPQLFYNKISKEVEIDLSKFPSIVVELGKRLVEEIGLGIWTINPEALKIACPPSDKDGFVSPSAMQLALSTSKPDWSGVSFSEKIPKILNDLKNTNDVQLIKARAQMERANRALERRRWINWYNRQRNWLDNAQSI